jgi:hypothetical protein
MRKETRVATANEIANEARDIAASSSVAPGARPEALVVAEILRNLATLVSELASHVEEVTRQR